MRTVWTLVRNRSRTWRPPVQRSSRLHSDSRFRDEEALRFNRASERIALSMSRRGNIPNMKTLLEFRFFPAAAVLLLVVTYVAFDLTFLYCKLNNCQALDGRMLSPSLSGDLKVKCDNNSNDGCIERTLEAKNKELAARNEAIGRTQEDLRIVQHRITERLHGADPAESAAIARDEAFLKSRTAELTTLIADRDHTAADITALRTNVSRRYSSRLWWSFLSAMFFLLCAIAIFISCSTITASTAKTGKWIRRTTIVALVFSTGAFVSGFFPSRGYLAVMAPMLNETLYKHGDLKLFPVNLFNVLGMAATIFLVSASCAVLGSVRDIEKSDDLARDGDRLALRAVVDRYKDQLNNLKVILYVGALMLFFGMLQLKMLGDWHLLFVAFDPKDPSVTLLSDYFKYSISVQAGYFAVALGVIYLPVSYVILRRARSLPLESEEERQWLEKRGLSFSVQEYLPKLVTILSPLLAGPAFDLFSYLAKS